MRIDLKFKLEKGLSLLEVGVVMLISLTLATNGGALAEQCKFFYQAVKVSRDVLYLKQNLMKGVSSTSDGTSIKPITKNRFLIIKQGKYDNEVFQLACSFIGEGCVKVDNGEITLPNGSKLNCKHQSLSPQYGIGVFYDTW